MRRTLIGLVVAVLALAGCGSAPEPAPEAGATVTHAFGTTAVPAEPTRIVALSFEEDALAAVGLRTVARRDNLYEPGAAYPWQVGKVDLTDVQPVVDAKGTVDFERLAALKPDLILATNFYGIDQAMYATLSGIAPTVGPRTAVGAAGWQELATQVGEAVGRSAEMATAVREVEDGVAALGAELPGLQGATYAGAYHFAPGQFRVNTNPEAQTARIMGALGVSITPALPGAVADGMLSQERLGALDADFLIITFATPELRTQLEQNPLYSGLGVVRGDRVFVGDNFTAAASNNPTVLTIPWLLAQERDTLARVAADRA